MTTTDTANRALSVRLSEVSRYVDESAWIAAWGRLGIETWDDLRALPTDAINALLAEFDIVGHRIASRYDNGHGEVTVRVGVILPSGRGADVTVYGPRLRYRGTVVPAEINWSALGSSSPADAAAYASAIAFASGVAATLPAPTPSEED